MVAGTVAGLVRGAGGIVLDPRITAIKAVGRYRSVGEQTVELCRFRGEPVELVPIALLALRIRVALRQLGDDLDAVTFLWPSGGAVP